MALIDDHYVPFTSLLYDLKILFERLWRNNGEDFHSFYIIDSLGSHLFVSLEYSDLDIFFLGSPSEYL